MTVKKLYTALSIFKIICAGNERVKISRILNFVTSKQNFVFICDRSIDRCNGQGANEKQILLDSMLEDE